MAKDTLDDLPSQSEIILAMVNDYVCKALVLNPSQDLPLHNVHIRFRFFLIFFFPIY